MWEQVREAVDAIEAKSDQKFGDPEKPLLVSCRSGAKFSMLGMMDTVLNIGLNDETAQAMIALTADAVLYLMPIAALSRCSGVW